MRMRRGAGWDRRGAHQQGAAAIEAALIFPVFLVSLLSAMFLMVAAYRVVTLQFLAGEVVSAIATRQPDASISLAYVQDRANAWGLPINSVEWVGSGAGDGAMPVEGTVFTVRIISGVNFPFVGRLNLPASAVGIMERL